MYDRDERIKEWLQEHKEVTAKLENLVVLRNRTDGPKTKEEGIEKFYFTVESSAENRINYLK